MNEVKKILVVDDEEFIRSNLSRILGEANYFVETISDGKTALQVFKKDKYDLVLLDLNMPDIGGLEVLQKIKKVDAEALVIVITGFASIESAVEALKLGAYDYIKKPFKADAIKLIIKLALETLSLKKEVKKLKRNQPHNLSFDDILGNSDKINQVKHQIKQFAKYDSETVLITGESGVGKELIAHSIHSLSPRAEKDFIEINCASIPENLLESELFGYEKGAFTDARKTKIGLIEKANKGSLFLDEIGEMSPSLQAKLLRVLENKRFRRLGSTTDIQSDVRIIAATNKDINKAIEEKDFRQDLYYRLNVLRVIAPPLRERGNDIIELSEYFLKYFAKKFGKSLFSFSDDVKKLLLNYNWPGNVRELRNSIERISILQNESVIQIKHIDNELFHLNKNNQTKVNYDSFNSNLSYKETLKKVEFDLIKNAFEQSGKNISKTARILEIPRETLRYKLERFKIN